MRGRAPAYVAIGLSGVLIIASLTVFGGIFPRSVIVLGIGVVLLSSAMVFLQLSYWREGEARNRDRTELAVQTSTQRAPSELRNPHLRRVWENLEESRRLLEHKEMQERKAERRKEKTRLGLSDDEEILFMAEPSWLTFGPLAILSAISLLVSALVTNPLVSFLCLGLGLGGLLILTVLKGRTRYYLTNFRVLVRERLVASSGARWSSIPYAEVQHFSLRGELGRKRLELEGRQETVTLRGLTGASLLTVAEILRRYLPAVDSSRDYSSRSRL